MTKKMHDTPLLDELESGPWPSFVTGLKRLAKDEGKPYADMMKDLLGQLEHSYEASARVISTVDEMLATLMSVVR